MGLDRLGVRTQAVAGRGEGDRTDDVRAAGLVPGRTLLPDDTPRGHRLGGSAAGEVGRGGVEPVGAAGQHAGTEGRVELVAREHDVVQAEVGEVHRAVRGVLGGVEHHPRPGLAGDRRELTDRPDLAGDVGGAGEDDQPVASGVLAQRSPQEDRGVRDAAGHREAMGPAGRPRQEGRVVLGLEDEHVRVAGQAAGQEVEGVGAVAGEDDLVALARPDEGPHLGASLLVPRGGHPGGPAVAPVHRGVGAQGGVDRGLHADQRGGGGGVVEVRVVDRAVQGRHGQGLGHDGGEGADLAPAARVGDGAQVGAGVGEGRAPAEGWGRGARDRHERCSWSGWDPRCSRVRACRLRVQTARSSPGAPHRGGGLLVSKPGLRADTHDLESRVGRRSAHDPARGRSFPSSETWEALGCAPAPTTIAGRRRRPRQTHSRACHRDHLLVRGSGTRRPDRAQMSSVRTRAGLGTLPVLIRV